MTSQSVHESWRIPCEHFLQTLFTNTLRASQFGFWFCEEMFTNIYGCFWLVGVDIHAMLKSRRGARLDWSGHAAARHFHLVLPLMSAENEKYIYQCVWGTQFIVGSRQSKIHKSTLEAARCTLPPSFPTDRDVSMLILSIACLFLEQVRKSFWTVYTKVSPVVSLSFTCLMALVASTTAAVALTSSSESKTSQLLNLLRQSSWQTCKQFSESCYCIIQNENVCKDYSTRLINISRRLIGCCIS